MLIELIYPATNPGLLLRLKALLFSDLAALTRECSDYPAAWARGYKTFLCSTQLSMKFQMLISIKISRNSAFVRLR